MQLLSVWYSVETIFHSWGICASTLFHKGRTRLYTPCSRSWVYYDNILEESVLAYRSKGKERRGYLGQAFMSTHSFSTENVKGPMLDLMGKYSIRDASVLASCYDKVCWY